MRESNGRLNVVGIIYHEKNAAARPLAESVADWLASHAVATHLFASDEEAALQERVNELSLLVVLGGDGSILHAARLVAPAGVPLFGINLGRVGFLTEARPEGWQPKLGRALAGDYWIERRLMLQAGWYRQDQLLNQYTALNDVVISRGPQARVVRLNLYVDDDYVTTYTADGLIVATPTGSTAYSMAAGGPILPPELKNFLVIPVAPHLSFARALVLHQEAVVTIELQMNHEAMLTADGQAGMLLEDGDRIIIATYRYESLFARVDSPSYFYHSLLERLGLSVRRP